MDTYNQTLLTEHWRLTIYPEISGWGEMFDLKADPGKHHNLSRDPCFQETLDELAQKLAVEFPPAPPAGSEPLWLSDAQMACLEPFFAKSHYSKREMR